MTEKKRRGPLPGMLDLLILKAVALGWHHGYGVLQRIERITGDRIQVPEGSFYPAINRLSERKLVEPTWGTSKTGRRARFYRLTRKGRRHLQDATADWKQLAAGMQAALDTNTDESPTTDER